MRCSYINYSYISDHRHMGNQLNRKQVNQVVVDVRYEASIKSYFELKFKTIQIQELRLQLSDDNIIKRHYAIIGLRKIIYSQTDALDHFITKNLMSQIAKLAKCIQYPQMMLQAIWILRNIASESSEYVKILCQHNAIQILINALQSSHQIIVDEALFTLANICADSNLYRDKILSLGMIPINQLFKDLKKSEYLLKNGVWAISNICRMKPNPPYQLVKQSLLILIDILANMQIQVDEPKEIIQQIFYDDSPKQNLEISDESLGEIEWTLNCYTSQLQIHQLLIQDKVINKILFHKNNEGVNLLILNQLVRNDPSTFILLINHDKHFLTRCKELLSYCRYRVRVAVLRIIESACLGPQTNIQLLFEEKELMNYINSIIQNKSMLKQQSIILNIYINLIKRKYTNEIIINFLSQNALEIIKKVKSKPLIFNACLLVYQILLFCYKCKDKNQFYEPVFEKWKHQWEERGKQRINHSPDQKVIEIMLRINRIILIANGQ